MVRCRSLLSPNGIRTCDRAELKGVVSPHGASAVLVAPLGREASFEIKNMARFGTNRKHE